MRRAAANGGFNQHHESLQREIAFYVAHSSLRKVKVLMIISDKHKYLFLETPHTGSTAIAKELIEKYDGEEIVYKHANYHEFLKIANAEQRQYFVFAGVRNPLDEAVSLYYKFLTNHKNNYTDPAKLLKNGGWVTDRKVEIYELVQETKSFYTFLRRFYPWVYTSNINLNKQHCDFIVRFEHLDDDLTEALGQIGIEKVRPLPVVNKTDERGEFEDYYEKRSFDLSTRIFGPFLKEWDYKFPKNWEKVSLSRCQLMKYKVAKIGRGFYSKFIKGGPLSKLTVLRNRME